MFRQRLLARGFDLVNFRSQLLDADEVDSW